MLTDSEMSHLEKECVDMVLTLALSGLDAGNAAFADYQRTCSASVRRCLLPAQAALARYVNLVDGRVALGRQLAEVVMDPDVIEIGKTADAVSRDTQERVAVAWSALLERLNAMARDTAQ